MSGRRWGRRLSRGLSALLLAAVTACAATPAEGPQPAADPAADAANDPAEPLNRGIFAFNRGVDTMVLKPAGTFYRDVLPPPVQSGLHNFLNNLRSPVILLHDLLQGELERAGETVARFVVNTTAGLLGFRDQAAEWGIPFHDEDMGQTLGAWGVGEGPYVMLPVLGPSNPRDTLGLVVDFLIDPVNILADNTGHEDAIPARTGTAAIDSRARHIDALDELEKTSVDFYAALRSAYRQRREHLIANGDPDALPQGPQMNLDLSEFGGEPEAVPRPGPEPVPEVAALPAPQEEQEETPAAEAAPAPEPSMQARGTGRMDAAWRSLAAVVQPRTKPAAPPEPAVHAAPDPRPATRAAAESRSRPKTPDEARLHLASYQDHQEALEGWESFVDRYGTALSGAEPEFTEVVVGDQHYVRLIAALPAEAAGESPCDALRADAAYCQVMG